jgi:hypothetical protein
MIEAKSTFSPVTAEPRAEERVRDRGVPVLHQQGALQDQRHLLDDPARLRLVHVGQRGAELVQSPVDALVDPADGGEELLHRLGFPLHRAQDVQRGDIAGALPDRHQR